MDTAALKKELGLEYIEGAGEEKLARILDTGKEEIFRKSGSKEQIDFEDDLVAKNLLIMYCMYSWANKLSDFWDHYNHDFLALRDSYGNPI